MGKMTMCELEARINVDSLKRPKFPPHVFCFLFSRKDFFFFFNCFGDGGERGREQRLVAPSCTCPGWDQTPDFVAYGMTLRLTEPHGPGLSW